MNPRLSQISKTAGPGILFASAAIGVSHLVQSTRAGADYGMLLVGFVVLVALLKYPFFEYSSRYANVTQTSIIDGYKRLGRPALWLYLLLTLGSMFFVTGAVGFVTAGFFENLFGIDLGPWTVVMLFGICVAILAVGRYQALDILIKVIVIVLIVSTVSAFLFAVYNGPAEQREGFEPMELWSATGIFFLLALMGWMPVGTDHSSWNSLWTLERVRQSGYRPKLRETLLEFRITYLVTIALAVMFLVLGALIFYGTGDELPDNNALFAHTVVALYTQTIGEWSHVIIAASAFTAMFGTVLTVLDGYSRAVRRTVELIVGDRPGIGFRPFHVTMLLVLAAGSLAVVLQFGENFKELVDFATALSFVIAPVIAVFNFRLVTGRYIRREYGPSGILRALSFAGIAFLCGFALLFVAVRFA